MNSSSSRHLREVQRICARVSEGTETLQDLEYLQLIASDLRIPYSVMSASSLCEQILNGMRGSLTDPSPRAPPTERVKPRSLPARLVAEDLGGFGFGVAAAPGPAYDYPPDVPQFGMLQEVMREYGGFSGDVTPVYSGDERPGLRRCSDQDRIEFPDFPVTADAEDILAYVADVQGPEALDAVVWSCPCMEVEYMISDVLDLYTTRKYRSPTGHFTLRDVIGNIAEFYQQPFDQGEAEGMIERLSRAYDFQRSGGLTARDMFEALFGAETYDALLEGDLPRQYGVATRSVVGIRPSELGTVRLLYENSI
jgi:hypothetical protein